MSTVTVERRRTGWDVVLGILLVLAALIILGDVAFATVVSVLVLGWTSLLAGLLMLAGAILRIRAGGGWSIALGGAVLTVLGLFMLRNLTFTAMTLTVLAGALFLSGGLARVVSAVQSGRHRVLLMVSGLVSVVLGLYVLFNPAGATLSLLGILLGIQVLVEGLTLILLGRVRVAGGTAAPAAGATAP